MDKKIHEQLHEQLHEQFHNAFYDTIKQSIETEEHGYVVLLYSEIRDRLALHVKKNGKTYQRIHEQLDVPFFEQLLSSRQFDWNSMRGLINTTYQWIHDLQMPLRDTTTEESKQRLLKSTGTMAEVVAIYIKEVHLTLDLMDRDMEDFYKNRHHPVVQNMLQHAVSQCREAHK
tara:strand:- start:291 stop:809 length:519 start_codon:yes stop_codon:yes gene_type:complete